jgi:hypothetical protein
VLAERSGNLLAGAGCLLEEAATVLPEVWYICVCVGVLNVVLDCVWTVQRRTLADVGWSCALRTSCVVPSRGGEEDSSILFRHPQCP